MDRVVLDDAGYLKEEWIYVCSALIANGEGKMLVLLSGISENSVGEYFEKYRPVCNYIPYSWEDMVKDNIFSLRDVAEIWKAREILAFMIIRFLYSRYHEYSFLVCLLILR